MQLLAMATGNPAIGSLANALAANPHARHLDLLRAPGKERALELLTSRVDEGDAAAQAQPGRNPHLEARSPEVAKDRASADPQRAAIEKLDAAIGDAQSRLETEIALAVTPRNIAVTYQLYPELALRFQRSLIDRTTAEVVREIPSDSYIEVALRYHELIGRNLDVSA